MASATDGFLLFDSNLNAIEVDTAAMELFALKKQDVIGKSISHIWPDIDKDGRYAAYLEVLKTGKPFFNEDTVSHPEAGKLRLAVRAFKVGDCLGIIATDITLQMRGEEERKKLEALLRQAQKTEAIGTLTGGIAHDFNNILTAIIGYTEIALSSTSKDTPLHSNLEEVLRAGYRARDLVKQLLTFSRQTEQEQKPLQISFIIKEALKMLRASLPTTIEIRQNIKTDSAKVMADPTQIHQVLLNLCTNAAHSMHEKGGILEVSVSELELNSRFTARHPDLKPGPHVKLTVSDTGHGMSHAVLQRIFDPYFTTQKRREGTGLGMAVVHGIVKGYGGSITVYSEPYEGTTFNVFLPRIPGKDSLNIRPAAPPPGGKEQILFVDDEQVLVDLGKQMLQQMGYTVTTTTSSIKALQAFRTEPEKFDLVVTDMTMPKMTGFELAEKLLQIRSELPIVLCSGFSEMVTQEKAKAIGIREFVMKPIIASEMAKIIRRALDKKDDAGDLL